MRQHKVPRTRRQVHNHPLAAVTPRDQQRMGVEHARVGKDPADRDRLAGRDLALRGGSIGQAVEHRSNVVDDLLRIHRHGRPDIVRDRRRDLENAAFGHAGRIVQICVRLAEARHPRCEIDKIGLAIAPNDADGVRIEQTGIGDRARQDRIVTLVDRSLRHG